MREHAPPSSVPLAMIGLRDRARRELERMQGTTVPGTEAVGGWAKIGICLDALLRNTFARLCEASSRIPDAEFQRLSRQPTWVVTKGSAGQFANVIPLLAREVSLRDVWFPGMLHATSNATSALRRAINVRNVIVHGRQQPTTAELEHLLRELIAWCDTLE